MDKPTKMNDLDVMRMAMLAEKGGRLEAEAQATRLVIQRIESERVQLEVDQRKLGDELKERYGLSAGDKVNFKTGEILRAPEGPASPLPPALRAVTEPPVPAPVPVPEVRG